MRVLVLGGYGFFGQRLVRRLAAQAGLHIVVAGRSPERARALITRLSAPAATLSPARLDTQAPDFPDQLAAQHPAVVVHTAGPFQGQDYRVAEACIAAGAHYIDLADGRAFVGGITRLDAAARHAGVAVLSGASSVPALSGAVADALARGLARVDSIDTGISPGNRTERGLATVRAILGYCGQPIASRQAATPTGWLGTWQHAYPAPVGPRLLSPCDVPDLDVLHGRYPGEPAIRFGAGLELRLLHRAMNTMAWLAHRGWVPDWAAHAPWLLALSEGFRGWGSDAGAMHVRLAGRTAEGRPVERLWQLVAAAGDGPYVPTLAAAALVRRLAAARPRMPGARPCVGELAVEDILHEAEGLAITTTRQDLPAPPSLYRAVMGPAYERLHPALQYFHGLQGHTVLHGEVATQGPQGALGRLLARLTGTPLQERSGPIRFVLDAAPAEETWTREFPGQVMRSCLRLVQGQVVESLGAARLVFGLAAEGDVLVMQLRAMRFLGIPCPRWLLPRVVARERGEGSRLHFEISAGLPVVGRIAGYRGWLELPGMEDPQ